MTKFYEARGLRHFVMELRAIQTGIEDGDLKRAAGHIPGNVRELKTFIEHSAHSRTRGIPPGCQRGNRRCSNPSRSTALDSVFILQNAKARSQSAKAAPNAQTGFAQSSLLYRIDRRFDLLRQNPRATGERAIQPPQEEAGDPAIDKPVQCAEQNAS